MRLARGGEIVDEPKPIGPIRAESFMHFARSHGSKSKTKKLTEFYHQFLNKLDIQ